MSLCATWLPDRAGPLRNWSVRRKLPRRTNRRWSVRKAIRQSLSLPFCAPGVPTVVCPLEPHERAACRSAAAPALLSSENHLGHHRRAAHHRLYRGTTGRRRGQYRGHDGTAAGLAEPRRDFAGAFLRIFEPGAAAVAARHSAVPGAVAFAGSLAECRARISRTSRSPASRRSGAPGTKPGPSRPTFVWPSPRARPCRWRWNRRSSKRRTQNPQLLRLIRMRRHRLRRDRRSAHRRCLRRAAHAKRGPGARAGRDAGGAQFRGGRNVLAGTVRHLGRGRFQTSDLAEFQAGGFIFAAGPATRSTWRAAKFPRPPSNKFCAGTKPSPNAWSLACRAGMPIAPISLWRVWPPNGTARPGN